MNDTNGCYGKVIFHEPNNFVRGTLAIFWLSQSQNEVLFTYLPDLFTKPVSLAVVQESLLIPVFVVLRK